MINSKPVPASARRYLRALPLALALGLAFGARSASAQSVPAASPTPARAANAPATPAPDTPRFQLRGSQLEKPSLATALILVDGRVMSLTQMNETVAPDSVYSIDILKGDQAVAKYGERGRRGVVLVTTKK